MIFGNLTYLAFGPARNVCVERSRVVPIPEAFGIMVRTAACCEDQREQDEADNDDDLEG